MTVLFLDLHHFCVLSDHLLCIMLSVVFDHASKSLLKLVFECILLLNGSLLLQEVRVVFAHKWLLFSYRTSFFLIGFPLFCLKLHVVTICDRAKVVKELKCVDLVYHLWGHSCHLEIIFFQVGTYILESQV